MKPKLEFELERQIYQPGEIVEGKAVLTSEKPVKFRNLYLTLHGEEAIRNKLLSSWVTPLFKDEQILYPPDRPKLHQEISKGEYGFSFQLPTDPPPSFASAHFQCQYYLTARLDIPWGKDVITKYHLAILPKPKSLPKNPEIEFGFKEKGLDFKAFLEKEYFFIGDIIKGNFHLRYLSDNPPHQILFQIKAQGDSTDKRFPFSEVIWSAEKTIKLELTPEPVVKGEFGFTLPEIVPFSGTWETFRVNWQIEAEIILAKGQKHTAQSSFEVYKFYE